MQRVITGISIDENYLSGARNYGVIGTLIGVACYEHYDIAFIKNKKYEYVYRFAVIDTSVSMAKRGPVVSEMLILSKSEYKMKPSSLEKLEKSLEQFNNLELMGRGEVDVNLSFEFSNKVYICEDEILKYFKDCKYNHPNLPLFHAARMYPYDKENIKVLKKI